MKAIDPKAISLKVTNPKGTNPTANKTATAITAIHVTTAKGPTAPTAKTGAAMPIHAIMCNAKLAKTTSRKEKKTRKIRYATMQHRATTMHCVKEATPETNVKTDSETKVISPETMTMRKAETTPDQRPKRNSLLICLLATLFFSCTQPALYDQYQPIENAVWEKNKEYYFSFQVSDISVPYDVTLEIRNNNLYPFQDLWVFYSEEQPIGPLKRDTLQCMLADNRGKWHGKGISLFQSSFPLRKRYTFSHTGQYTFSIRQGMRNDSLPGIQEIGMRVIQSP